MNDLVMIGSEAQTFFRHSNPRDPLFPRSDKIDWQYLLDNLKKDATRFLSSISNTSRSFWAINHVLYGDAFYWQTDRPLSDLRFKVFALRKGDFIPWCNYDNPETILFQSEDCPWWPSFAQSLREIDIKTADAPMYEGDWETYFDIAYRAQVFSSLLTATSQLGLRRDPNVNVGPWPGTSISMSETIAPGGTLHLLMNFEGETAEEVLSDAYGYARFSPSSRENTKRHE
ncbi:hypothetical protein [Labrenzia sp. VG12]|uniref:hypothetical protein n=1 Tax=Labrenzia sp. VG12 TaxID=2021862 RepID=UPI0012FE0F18|nr:hypothetical protein [Labrenzia sp. VG12]